MSISEGERGGRRESRRKTDVELEVKTELGKTGGKTLCTEAVCALKSSSSLCFDTLRCSGNPWYGLGLSPPS